MISFNREDKFSKDITASALAHGLLFLLLIVNIDFDPVKKIRVAAVNPVNHQQKTNEPEIIKATIVDQTLIQAEAARLEEQAKLEQENKKQLEKAELEKVKQQKIAEQKQLALIQEQTKQLEEKRKSERATGNVLSGLFTH